MNRLLLFLRWMAEPFTHSYSLDNTGLFENPHAVVNYDEIIELTDAEWLERCLQAKHKITTPLPPNKHGH